MDKQNYFNVFYEYKDLTNKLISKEQQLSEISYDCSNELSKEECNKLYDKLVKEFMDIDFCQFTLSRITYLYLEWIST